MTPDWQQITSACIGAVTAISAIAAVAIPAWFKIKKEIAEGKTASAVNSARIDVHDTLEGIITASKKPQAPIPGAPIQPMSATPASKIP